LRNLDISRRQAGPGRQAEFAHKNGAQMAIIPDPWLMFLHAIPFGLTMLMLHFVLFKPMISYLGDRDKAIVGSREDAKRLEEKAEEKLAQYEAALANARADVSAVRAAARATAMEEREAAIANVRQEAETKIAAALVEIQAAAQVAAKELQPISSTLADDISNQVLSEAHMA